ncbi:F0F1 ATP synthase subunit A [Aminicella lysinilytica]|uniref:ATP synthase subunit a n=1 Tax=Aminicella lysinilytica TaxID=433323 RepID=A0A4R6QA30_9FIRM|nr:FoF1 ATP synthase subunit a [Aminicella lysinilytica]TDP58947.1 ATP synthase F0 subcomplex A subunit [Aminicella lysinilytica]
MNLNELGARIIVYFGSSGKFFLSESTCYAIILAVILAAVGIWLGSNLQAVPKGKQVLVELFVGWIYKFTEENLGKEFARSFAPYFGTLILWLVCANSLGLIGLRPITADVSITAGLAALSFVLIQYNAIRHLGIGGRLSEMRDPFSFMIIMDLISDLTFPVTLALRLFGNIFGGMIVVDLWLNLMSTISATFCPVPILRCVTVIPLNLFFDMFEPVIQGYIFTVLTAINLRRGMEGTSPETLERRRKSKEKRLAKHQAKQLEQAG